MLGLDGTRQYEIVISNPSYPDPFLAGDVTVVPPASRRVFDPNLTAPYYTNVSFAVERSLPRNLFISASFDFHRGSRLLRSRDMNAPFRELRRTRTEESQGPIPLRATSGCSSRQHFRNGTVSV
jgi:hypothetical protein